MRGNLLFHMQMLLNIFPRISVHCKLVLVQEYKYGLLSSQVQGSLLSFEYVTWKMGHMHSGENPGTLLQKSNV